MLTVIRNPLAEDVRDRERCSVCRTMTFFWYPPKDVALCEECAKTKRRADVPTKKEWFEQGKRKERWSPNLCGKPYSHWEGMAKELVIDQLVRASMIGGSTPGDIASRRLLELAKTEDPAIFDKVLQERARCHAGFAAIMKDILTP
jgi:hypothetical protein